MDQDEYELRQKIEEDLKALNPSDSSGRMIEEKKTPLFQKIISFIVLAFCIISLIFLMTSIGQKKDNRSKASAKTPLFVLNAGKANFSPNEEFLLNVFVDPQKYEITVADIKLNFEKNDLQVLKINNGTLFPVTLKNPVIATNSAEITVGSDKENPVKEFSLLVSLTIKVQPNASSSTQISFDQKTSLTALNQQANVAILPPPLIIQIEATKSSDIIIN